MRERSTWNRDEVVKKVAGLQKQADPYTMNQDHPQPAADKYVTGDPSTFAEDVHTPNTWDVEYKGDEVKRDEIGMADYRPDTFNHPEKTAAQRETLHKKSKLCVAVARLMLAGQKTASLKAIEDQAFALMHMPDEALISTHKRLAGEQGDEDEGDEGQEKQAQQDEKDEGQQEQAKQAQQDEKKDEGGQEQAKQAQDQAQQDDQGQDKQAKDDQNDKANKNWPTKEASVLVGQVVASLQAGNFKSAQEQIQQLVQQQTAGMDQQQLAQQIQQMIQQAMGQQQMPPAQQAQQVPVQQQVQVSDEQVLDQMLAQDNCGPMAEVDIQMDPAQMDVMAGELGPEDEALRTLFAQDDEAKDEGEQQAKQANIRTASNRTVGTRPTAGVAKLGGAASSGNGAPDLSSLWQSAPDVRDVFGM